MRSLYKPTKWISLVSVLFFGWAAAMQLYGDPDTFYWFAIYAAIALCSLVNLFNPGKGFTPFPLIVAGIALIWALLLLPDFDLIVDGKVLNIFDKSIEHKTEVEREVFGLLLVLLFSIYELFHCTIQGNDKNS